MSNSKKIAYTLVVIVAVIVVASIAAVLGAFGTINPLSEKEVTVLVSIINGAATIVLAAVAAVNMREGKMVRGEMVRPHLALEPAYYEFDMKTGEITGFTCLNLVNGGAGARDVEIDFCCGEKCSMLYASSIGTNDRVQLWNGRFSELGSSVKVDVRYKNRFGKALEESFSIDIDSIRKSKRKFVPVLNASSAK
jgi:hypothetical protein